MNCPHCGAPVVRWRVYRARGGQVFPHLFENYAAAVRMAGRLAHYAGSTYCVRRAV